MPRIGGRALHAAGYSMLGGPVIARAPSMFGSAMPVEWGVFGLVVLCALVLDRTIFGKPKAHISFREAAIRSAFFIAVGLGFTGYVACAHGSHAAITYLTAYLVEESLSVDNLFVFLVLFTYFRVSEYQQQRILTWGIIGAIVMRGIFIAAGTALLIALPLDDDRLRGDPHLHGVEARVPEGGLGRPGE